jgi:hypothetical protein
VIVPVVGLLMELLNAILSAIVFWCMVLGCFYVLIFIGRLVGGERRFSLTSWLILFTVVACFFGLFAWIRRTANEPEKDLAVLLHVVTLLVAYFSVGWTLFVAFDWVKTRQMPSRNKWLQAATLVIFFTGLLVAMYFVE